MFLLVAVLAVLLAVALPKSFFEDWGWLSGPAALLLCAFGTARVLGLPVARTLFGVVIAGVPGLLGVVTGVHWLGTLLAVVAFAVWCGFGPEPRRL
ncbi:MAG: hypothetical protein BGO23_08935 [Solirubrobacterales bacterium 67-14]|nr:MAG: hypothetical protein BGO23_08935 [Solirubrobacterales bacterium 67-14]